VTTCGNAGTDPQNNPTCTGGTGNGGPQTITFSPQPSIGVTHSGPDSNNIVTINATYHFPYNHTGRVRIFFDGSQINGTFTSTSDGVVSTTTDLSCATPGTHQIQAKAFICASVSPEVDPTDPNFIGISSIDSVPVNDQTTVNATFNQDNEPLPVSGQTTITGTLTINSNFPFTKT